MDIIEEVQIYLRLRILKKLCKKGVHNSFVAHYKTVVGEFLGVFHIYFGSKNSWFSNFVAASGWKRVTDESLGFKVE